MVDWRILSLLFFTTLYLFFFWKLSMSRSLAWLRIFEAKVAYWIVSTYLIVIKFSLSSLLSAPQPISPGILGVNSFLLAVNRTGNCFLVSGNDVLSWKVISHQSYNRLTVKRRSCQRRNLLVWRTGYGRHTRLERKPPNSWWLNCLQWDCKSKQQHFMKSL